MNLSPKPQKLFASLLFSLVAHSCDGNLEWNYSTPVAQEGGLVPQRAQESAYHLD